jgi:hypothetical protein
MYRDNTRKRNNSRELDQSMKKDTQETFRSIRPRVLSPPPHNTDALPLLVLHYTSSGI